jgi:hypothetical protein
MKMRRMLVLVGILFVFAVGVLVGVRYLTTVPGQSHSGPLPALASQEAETVRRLRAHVTAIASRPHNIEHYEELEKAARYIESALTTLGYQTIPQVYQADGRAVRNIEVVLEPTTGSPSRGTIVLGAHYDSYGDAPGANDNGTGTAAVLELARLLTNLRGQTNSRIRLVLFVNEEPPYFQTADMGSYRYARLLAERGEPIIGMISLETLGCFLEEPGTQHYPPPLGLLYPTKGDFVAFVGMVGSREFLHALIRSFRNHTEFPTVGGVAPGFVPGIDWSDHWSFEKFRYPAVMITDTAYFRYQHYHKPTDTPDKVDYERLARITHGIERVVREMVRPEWPTGAAEPRL